MNMPIDQASIGDLIINCCVILPVVCYLFYQVYKQFKYDYYVMSSSNKKR